MADRHESSGPTRRRSWHGPASARRPSRLGTSKPLGVTRRAFARLTCSAPRAALASARGPWPCSLASDPLGRFAAGGRTICRVGHSSDMKTFENAPKRETVVPHASKKAVRDLSPSAAAALQRRVGNRALSSHLRSQTSKESPVAVEAPSELALAAGWGLSEKHLASALYRWRRAAMRKASGLNGAELKAAMDAKYKWSRWYYVRASRNDANALNSWNPVSDLVDLAEGLTITVTSPPLTEELHWSVPDENPLVLRLSAETLTVKIVKWDSDIAPDAISLSHNGLTVLRASVNAGGEASAKITAADGDVLEFTCIQAPQNIRNTGNPTASPSGPVWSHALFKVLVTHQDVSVQRAPMPRLVGPFSGSLGEFLRSLKRRGSDPLSY